jgi:DNA-directed RNA polymerase subunit H (RpoH/RPB5)
MSKNIDLNTFIPELLPIEKSHHIQLNDIKTNLIKILVNRKFINIENQDRSIEKIIKEDNDDQEYIINLDNESNYNTTIIKKRIYVKIFDYKITSINKNSPIGEFISKYNDEYKILIVQNINQKSENIIQSYETPTEVFKLIHLMINIVDHVLVPKHIVLKKEEGDAVLQAYRAKKRDMMLIRTTDPVARYYNMKAGEIIKIMRPSVMTVEAPAYRLVIKSKDNKAKT